MGEWGRTASIRQGEQLKPIELKVVRMAASSAFAALIARWGDRILCEIYV
jgi:hypothetical protein